MEEKNIDNGVECDGNVVEKDKMLHENMQHPAELIRRNKENSETIERLLSQVHKLSDENKFLRINLGIHKDTTDHTIAIHEDATDHTIAIHKDATNHTITRKNKPQFSRSKSMGPSFPRRLTGCTGT
ncbi:hypothetical protein EV2_006432 [Malus domestica]